MSVPPELRVPQSADADCPRREVACRHCRGFGECLHIRSAGDSFAPIGWPDREWCCECGGAAFLLVPCLPDGASARLGAMLVEAMPHLRHATWPPKEVRGGLATAIGLVGMVRP